MQQINLADDPTICDEVAERLDELRTAWATLLAHGAGDQQAPYGGAIARGAAGQTGLAVSV
jgi:flagellin-specific chaperone FliS